jgi:hypothetical protein
MKKRMLIAVSSGVLILIASCVQDPQLTDEDHIYQLLVSSDLAKMGALEGQGEDMDGKDSTGVDLPEIWWRELTTEGSFQIFISGDIEAGICTVTVNHNLYANFYIDVVHDQVINPGVKTIEDFRERRVIVERTGDPSSTPHGGWTIQSITPAEFSLLDSGEQEVFIVSMKLSRGEEVLLDCTSPDQFIDIEDLPELSEGELVKLEVTVLHTNPQYEPPYFVFVHGPCPTWPRHLMYDDGNFGDETAGDGIYTYEWYKEDSFIYFHKWRIAADIIDADTMADQIEEDYDSGAWCIPVIEL